MVGAASAVDCFADGDGANFAFSVVDNSNYKIAFVFGSGKTGTCDLNLPISSNSKVTLTYTTKTVLSATSQSDNGETAKTLAAADIASGKEILVKGTSEKKGALKATFTVTGITTS